MIDCFKKKRYFGGQLLVLQGLLQLLFINGSGEIILNKLP